MTLPGPRPISVDDAIGSLRFLADRSPTTTPAQSAEAFSELSPYRDGGIFVGYWAGSSEWERHTAGDEIVMVLEGETTIFFQTEAGEQSAHLGTGHLVVVPQGTWHRFETNDAVKLMSVTPQPTDHSAELPS